IWTVTRAVRDVVEPPRNTRLGGLILVSAKSCTSAGARTVVLAAAVLLPMIGSSSAAPRLAALLIVPAPGGAVSAIVTVEAPPAGRLARVQSTVPSAWLQVHPAPDA